jgi:hypothetical protein
MVGENAGNIQGRDNITGKSFYFELDVDINKSVGQMHANISAAEDRARVSKRNEEKARQKVEEAMRMAENERARAVESRKNEESSKRLAEEEKQKRLEAEAEVHELRVKLGLQGHA